MVQHRKASASSNKKTFQMNCHHCVTLSMGQEETQFGHGARESAVIREAYKEASCDLTPVINLPSFHSLMKVHVLGS